MNIWLGHALAQIQSAAQTEELPQNFFEKIWAWILSQWQKFCDVFYLNFIKNNKWEWLVEGLGNTLVITFFAVLLGIAIGIVVAAVRSTYDKNGADMKRQGGFGWFMLRFFNGVCNLYLTVFRGTPIVVQLLIMYFVVFASASNDTVVAILAFGINSGAYVAEIFRAGILSIDNGQFEAGRALGFNYVQTMIHIITPQMFKAVLPTLCNEFIVLLKETSVAGYVGIMDLTKAGDLIRGRTFSAFMPLLAVALIYLVIVIILTKLVGLLERRLRKNER